MIAFPNAKINLGLNITGKRSDGYHDLETVFYPIGWKDVLEIVPSVKKINRKSEVQFRSSGIKISGGIQKNLCVRAYQLLKETHSIPAVDMHLHKIIPMGAGLGGGSSDAAFTLQVLDELFRLQIPENDLASLASRIGADCAFFLRNKPVFAEGTGNVFKEINLDLGEYFIVIVKPDVHVNTTTAYKHVVPSRPAVSIREILKKPVMEWKELLRNDFEESVFKREPLVGYLKKELYDAGAVYASMSGSGSAVYGIFSEEPEQKDKFKEYNCWTGKMEGI